MTVAVFFMTGVTLFAVIFLPLAELQLYFWGAAVVTFFIGDSITTGLLGKYNLEEQEIGYTRWACGAEPTMFCSFLTRGIALLVAGALYIGIVQSGFGLQFQIVVVSVLTLPIILAAGGLAATVINSYSILRSMRRDGHR
jgi:hypothetical protein